MAFIETVSDEQASGVASELLESDRARLGYVPNHTRLADVERLRELGLADAEILDVVLAAAARCFFSKTLDALCVEADASYGELDPELRKTLTVGRPIAAS